MLIMLQEYYTFCPKSTFHSPVNAFVFTQSGAICKSGHGISVAACDMNVLIFLSVFLSSHHICFLHQAVFVSVIKVSFLWPVLEHCRLLLSQRQKQRDLQSASLCSHIFLDFFQTFYPT